MYQVYFFEVATFFVFFYTIKTKSQISMEKIFADKIFKKSQNFCVYLKNKFFHSIRKA